MTHFPTMARAMLLLLSHCVALSAYASSTGDAPAGDTFSARATSDARIAPADAGRKALAAFESMLRAFEGGDVWTVRSSLNPSMIGYQKLVDSITSDNNQCKQLRVNLLDTHMQASQDRVVLQTGWEKRCLLMPSFSPALSKGRSTVLLRHSNDGWHVSSISAGNMFERIAADPVAPRVAAMPSATKPAVTLVTTPKGAAVAPQAQPPLAPTTCTIRGRPANCALVHYAANCTRTATAVACP